MCLELGEEKQTSQHFSIFVGISGSSLTRRIGSLLVCLLQGLSWPVFEGTPGTARCRVCVCVCMCVGGRDGLDLLRSMPRVELCGVLCVLGAKVSLSLPGIERCRKHSAESFCFAGICKCPACFLVCWLRRWAAKNESMGAVCPGDIYRETGIWEYGRSERQFSALQQHDDRLYGQREQKD